jgi:DNA-binding transcriptional LysR family regulator
MDQISHELAVFSRAIAYKNLSGAASHVGVSQPQLSRIIRRLEDSLGVILLDRGARRTATWTPTAYKLGEFYLRRLRSFERELEAIVQSTQTRQVQVGSLEGLVGIALPLVHFLLEKAGVHIVELDVYDLDRLEELFARSELDLILSSREPGRRKYSRVMELGYQSLDRVVTSPRFQVMSTYEYGGRRQKLKEAEKVLISNSLSIRRDWLHRYGGQGTLPSEPKKQKSSRLDTEPILLIGAETVSPVLWEKILKSGVGI